MSYNYVRIDGERVEVHVAAAYRNLDAAFKNKFGFGLLVASGTRTRAEQAELRARYVRYRDHGGAWAPLAAAPGYSNHEESGPRGPRALDVWDHGNDPGVTTSGTTRANWLRANAHKYGFNPAGYGFSRIEPWHIEFTGSLTGGVPASTEEEDMPLTSADIKKIWAEMPSASVKRIAKEATRQTWGRSFKETSKGDPWGAPKESAAKRLWRVVERAGRALEVGRQNRSRLAGQEKAIAALGEKLGLTKEQVAEIIQGGVDEALSDVSITLSAENDG